MTGELAKSRPFSNLNAVRERAHRHAARELASVQRAVDAPPLPAPVLALAAADVLARNLASHAFSQLAAAGALAEDERAVARELIAGLGGYGRTGALAENLSLPHGARIAADGEAAHLIRYWEPPVAPDPLIARFASLLNGRTGNGTLVAFTEHQRRTFEAGLELLAEVIPAVAGGLLPHVDLVCRVLPPPGAETTIMSTSLRDVPGVVFLGDAVLADRLLAAEHILHEACHQRFGELARDTSILCEGYDEDAGTKIAVPWHRPGGPATLWGVDKALTAAHVYLHLAYFYGMLDDARAFETPAEAEVIRRRTFSKLERTRYLLAALDATGRAQLGYAGNAFLDWMRELCASFAVADDPGARLTRLVFERCLDGDDELFRAADAFARADVSADAERYEAFMAWLDGLEPATSRRFAKCFTGAAPLDGAFAEHAPLARYCAARRGRARIMRELLLLAPDELARQTDSPAALTFARTESVNLDNFMSPRFRDRLVRERGPRAAAAR